VDVHSESRQRVRSTSGQKGPWRRKVRYVVERIPGRGIVIHQALSGPDAPLTKRDLVFIILYTGVAFIVVPAIIVAVIWGLS